MTADTRHPREQTSGAANESETTDVIALPRLPWAVGALAPVISSRTLQFHHGCHHAGYVESVNRALVQRSTIHGTTVLQIARWASKRPEESALFNAAAQAWNHEFHWNSLTPTKMRPSGALKILLERVFGDFANFANAFATAGAKHFGSGWLWLVLDDRGCPTIQTTADAGCPAIEKQTCLLSIDLWEHAYYLDHQNRRREYLDALIDRRLNWSFAQRNAAGEGAELM